VLHDDSGRIDVRVQAQGSGYLTVADAMTVPGWSVTVDGRPAKLLVGDDAFGTVSVPSGTHAVAFRYSAPGFHAGLAMSGVGVAGVVVLMLLDQRRRRPGQPEEPELLEESELVEEPGQVEESEQPELQPDP
jgi:uncharacterized membrane protein YfhO